jgi:hypothetical protein
MGNRGTGSGHPCCPVAPGTDPRATTCEARTPKRDAGFLGVSPPLPLLPTKPEAAARCSLADCLALLATPAVRRRGAALDQQDLDGSAARACATVASGLSLARVLVVVADFEPGGLQRIYDAQRSDKVLKTSLSIVLQLPPSLYVACSLGNPRMKCSCGFQGNVRRASLAPCH